jgi:hypothetical protein
MNRGKIEYIRENELSDGRKYLTLTIEGDNYSLWDKKYFGTLKEGQVVDFESRKSGNYNNITEIDIDPLINTIEELKPNPGNTINPRDMQIIRMSSIKSASYMVKDISVDLEKKVDLALDVARQFEKYATGELEDEEEELKL